MSDEKKIKAIKGMDSEAKCRGFQYEVGKTYEIPENEVEMCEKGFHAIDGDECPLKVFDYYAPAINGKASRYFEVTLSGKTDKKEEKVVGSKIEIGAEIGIPGLVKAHIEWVKRHLIKDDKPGAHKDGERSDASNTGNYSSASNTGYQSSASNTGNYSSAEVSGKESVAIVTGKGSKARGAKGCWLVLTERGDWDGETYPILGMKAVKVDGKKIKENTWYELKGGKVKEAE